MKIPSSILRLLTGTVVVGALSACSAGAGDSSTSSTSTPSTTKITPSTPTLSFAQTKRLRFTWADAPGATHYRLLENADGHSGFSEVSGDIAPGEELFDYQVPLFARINAQYMLQSCTPTDCQDSAPLLVSDQLAQLGNSVGQLKASDGSDGDSFGYSVSFNQAGDTLAVGAIRYLGVAGYFGQGAVCLFSRTGTTWSQQGEPIQAINADGGDLFGWSVSLNDAGDTLAVGAPGEDSLAGGINGENRGNDPEYVDAGAVYVFTRSSTGLWTQRDYIKASYPGGRPYDIQDVNTRGDEFGTAVSLNGTGDVLAVGAPGENSAITGTEHQPSPGFDYTSWEAGAVYIFSHTNNVWSQQAYIKASNTGSGDWFGSSVSLNTQGDVLAVGAPREDSQTTGIGGDEHNEGLPGDFDSDNDDIDLAKAKYNAGAVYVFSRSGTNSNWSQQAYIKASNAGEGDNFGYAVSLDGTGDTLAVGASAEDSGLTGINGVQSDNSALGAGAVYVFSRRLGCVGNLTPWCQQAYIKANNADALDYFGISVSLSDSGNTLAVGAYQEDSAVTGVHLPVGEVGTDNSLYAAGAAYVYSRSGDTWSQQAYIKANSIGSFQLSGSLYSYDQFGYAVSLDGQGDTLAVGAIREIVGNGTGTVFLY